MPKSSFAHWAVWALFIAQAKMANFGLISCRLEVNQTKIGHFGPFWAIISRIDIF